MATRPKMDLKGVIGVSLRAAELLDIVAALKSRRRAERIAAAEASSG